jgi:hypothetical protein
MVLRKAKANPGEGKGILMLWDRGVARRPPPSVLTQAWLLDNARVQAYYRYNFWRSSQHGWLPLASLHLLANDLPPGLKRD